MSEKIKKALRIAVNVGCGFEGDAEDAASLLSLIETNEARIAELENEHNVWLIGASNAVKNLETRIDELEAENKGYRMLIQDWIDIFDPQFTQRFSFIDGVRLAMIEAIKEREE